MRFPLTTPSATRTKWAIPSGTTRIDYPALMAARKVKPGPPDADHLEFQGDWQAATRKKPAKQAKPKA
jgi:hypothetical protein